MAGDLEPGQRQFRKPSSSRPHRSSTLRTCASWLARPFRSSGRQTHIEHWRPGGVVGKAVLTMDKVPIKRTFHRARPVCGSAILRRRS